MSISKASGLSCWQYKKTYRNETVELYIMCKKKGFYYCILALGNYHIGMEIKDSGKIWKGKLSKECLAKKVMRAESLCYITCRTVWSQFQLMFGQLQKVRDLRVLSVFTPIFTFCTDCCSKLFGKLGDINENYFFISSC